MSKAGISEAFARRCVEATVQAECKEKEQEGGETPHLSFFFDLL
ncbi:hypothetical protein [Pseudomonas capeferrum]|nr:hypothetical protein [Pseudomonas capeferrum]